MKTGNTIEIPEVDTDDIIASMEPGHEDREYLIFGEEVDHGFLASMEPGHEDREYMSTATLRGDERDRLNGARS